MTGTVRATQRWVLALTSAASLMVALDQLVVATALRSIQRDLHASLATLEWTVNAYNLSLAVLLITGAALGERFGRRRMFVVGLTIFTAASACCAVAPGSGWLIAARAVQGAGSALVMPLALTLLTAAFPPERRGAALGVFVALTGLAVVGGPLVGGAVTEGLAWPWIFWLNVPIGAVVIPLALRRIKESVGSRHPIDVTGVILGGVGMLGLVWGLVRANAAGWGSPEVVGAFVLGAVVTAAFVRWELDAATPMLPMRLFRDRTFSAGNASTLLLTSSLFSAVFFFSQYLQLSLGYRPLEAGLRFMPWPAAIFVMAPLAGRLADRIGPRPLVVSGLALQAVGIGWITLDIAAGRSYGASVAALMIAGCGTTMAMPAQQSAVLGAGSPSELATTSATFSAVRQLGGVFGVAILAAVFSVHGSYASPQSFADGVAPALAVSAGLALAGALAGLLIAPRRRGHPAAIGEASDVDERWIDAHVG